MCGDKRTKVRYQAIGNELSREGDRALPAMASGWQAAA